LLSTHKLILLLLRLLGGSSAFAASPFSESSGTLAMMARAWSAGSGGSIRICATGSGVRGGARGALAGFAGVGLAGAGLAAAARRGAAFFAGCFAAGFFGWLWLWPWACPCWSP